MRKYRTSSNVVDANVDDELEDDSLADDAEEAADDEPHVPQPLTPSVQTPKIHRQSKKRSPDPVDEALLQYLSTQNDEVVLFGILTGNAECRTKNFLIYLMCNMLTSEDHNKRYEIVYSYIIMSFYRNYTEKLF